MRQATIIVPSSEQAALSYAKRQAAKLFGGYTITQGQGGWIDASGALIDEPVSILTIACEPCEAANAKLDHIADEIGHIGRQDAVFVSYPTGDVAIRNTSPTQLAA